MIQIKKKADEQTLDRMIYILPQKGSQCISVMHYNNQNITWLLIHRVHFVKQPIELQCGMVFCHAEDTKLV